MDVRRNGTLPDPATLPGARPLRHAVVLGANGTMGHGGGALFTAAIPRITFLARTEEKAAEGLRAAVRLVRSGTVADRVATGSYDDLERVVADADLIFEAVAEDPAIKQTFFERIDAARKPTSIVATVTSGLSIAELARPRSSSFRRSFLGLHLFNPPNVIVGTELVAGPETDPDLVDFVEAFAVRRLGRVIIRTKDSPGFAGNRVGFKVLNEVAQLAFEHGPLLMDRLVGPYTGRSLPPLATIDLVGWDVHRAIVDHIHANAPDEARATLQMPAPMRRLLEKGVLGRKSGRGFTMKDGERRLVLDPRSGRYEPIESVELPDLRFIDEVCRLHRYGRYREAMGVFLDARGKEAALARRVIAGYLSYAYHRAGEVTEDISGIDRIMAFGFNWAPPSLLVETMGRPRAIGLIEEAGLPVPDSLREETSRRFTDHEPVDPGRFFIAA